MAFVWDAAVLNEIYVRSEYRGTGVADDLMDAALAFAREQTLPLDRLVLDVDRENERARRFYDRHGFAHWGAGGPRALEWGDTCGRWLQERARSKRPSIPLRLLQRRSMARTLSTYVDFRTSVAFVGSVLKYIGVTPLFPLVLAFYYGEDPLPFVATSVVMVGGGVLLEQLSDDTDLGNREAFLLVSLAWLVVPWPGRCRTSSRAWAASPTPSTPCSNR